MKRLELILVLFSLHGIQASNDTDLSICDLSPDTVPDANINSLTFTCEVSQIPSRLPELFPNLKSINIPRCNLSIFHWQDIYTNSLTHLNLTSCPIECDCKNMWMDSMTTFVSISLPRKVQICLHACDKGNIILNSTLIDVRTGDDVTIVARLENAIKFDLQSTRNRFSWVFKPGEHNHTETVDGENFQLDISNVSVSDMGIISITCWECADFLTTQVQVRVETPVGARFLETGQFDTELLLVHGFPIDNVSLTITKNAENVTETRLLPFHNDVTFFGNLILRPVDRKVFYQRAFKVFSSEVPHGDHMNGNLSFLICGPVNCQQLENNLKHLENQKIHFRKVDGGYSVLVVFSIFLLIFIFATGILFLGARYRPYIIQYYGKKVQQHPMVEVQPIRPFEDDHAERRVSGDTEVTLLRSEERSLLSDYTNPLVHFIPFSKIEIHEQIGKGAFGKVYMGSWEKTGPRSVAIKALHERDAVIEKEAAMIVRLDHPNVVKLHGMTKDGDLAQYLRNRSPKPSEYCQFPAPLTLQELKKIAYDVVSGVNYLTQQQIVHRDIAGRNCLVDGDSDMKCSNAKSRPPINVKISDFGMSRKLYNNAEYYRVASGTLLPVRWLPPESIDKMIFSHMSDIWSLGVTMWEIFSYGDVPFSSLLGHEVIELSKLGTVPPKPATCPDAFYDVMKKCWKINPEDRISAENILLEPCMWAEDDDVETYRISATETMQTIVSDYSDYGASELSIEPEIIPIPGPEPPKDCLFQPFDMTTSYNITPLDDSEFSSDDFHNLPSFEPFGGEVIPLSILGPSYSMNKSES